jgi:peptidoglycan/LPS O-acetylase OafA/YrhL
VNEAAVPSRDRSPSLTGLRAWAALAVVLYHLSTELHPLHLLSPAVQFGRTGVTLFFVLSGFVLTYTYYGQDTPPRVFYWRRFARIWPLHILVLLGAAALFAALGGQLTGRMVGPAALLLHAWVPDITVQRDILATSWSLSDEAFFYALFPFLVVPIARRWRSWHRIVAALLVLYVGYYLVVSVLTDGFLQTWALDYLPLIRLTQFAAGIAVGVAFKQGRPCPVPLPAALGLVLGWHVLLLVWDRFPPDLPFQPFSASQAFAFPLYALLVWAIADRDRAGRSPRLLASPPAIRFGHWSYAWYLIHKAGILVWIALLGRPQTMAGAVFAWLIVLVLTLGAAGLCFECWEKPVERWLKPRFLGAARLPNASSWIRL